MHAVDELVQSEKYGFGKVIKQTENSVTVTFFSDGSTKEFPYPQCFRKEMGFAEPMAQQEIEYEMRAHVAEKAALNANNRFDF